MPSSGMLRRVALVKISVSEEPRASIIRVTRVGDRFQNLESIGLNRVNSGQHYFYRTILGLKTVKLGLRTLHDVSLRVPPPHQIIQ
jgi:hypothetical protein